MRARLSPATNLPVIEFDLDGRLLSRVAGGAWRFHGWFPKGTVLQDAGAPLGVETEYARNWVTFGRVTPRGPVGPLDTVVQSLDGRVSVQTVWEGTAQISVDTSVELGFPVMRRSPVTRAPLHAGRETGEFECYVERGDVHRLRGILNEGRCWIKHDHAVCGLDCTLPRVVLAVVESYADESDADGRRFNFTWQRQYEGEEPGLQTVAGATYGEATREGFRLGDGSYLDFALRDFQ